MKKMSLSDSNVEKKQKSKKDKIFKGDSSSEDSSDEEVATKKKEDIEIEGLGVLDESKKAQLMQLAKKTIIKKKALPKSYYDNMKRRLRRMAKAGCLPDLGKLDEMIIDDQ
uniref:Uncharacterized protein n=1 Tax=Strombidium rassoulzadegani TaxID=1082188 RepID=A0A7S3CKR5_9SPIT|mmetsp:Transcript_14035/g.23848  ORF Transcript_14035/g.23848 Transcript_14035/m.23848 type:complete len:111 (+) Transcript_14035:266-598(+)